MKKFAPLALAATIASGSASPASAVDIKMDGEQVCQFQTASIGFSGKNDEFIGHRTRIGMAMVASASLSGYLQFQVGEDLWGTAIDGNGTQAENNIYARQMYLDWAIPGTEAKVRMGRHEFSMPAYVFCSPIVAYHVAEGVVIDLPLAESFDLTGFWTRAASNIAEGEGKGRDFDVFGLVGKVRLDRVDASPWLVYGSKDTGVTGDYLQSTVQSEAPADLLILGGGLRWKAFDPFTLELDAAWGKVSYGSGENQDDKGWYVAAGCSYALNFAVPALKAWYASGDGAGERFQSGHLPNIFGDNDASNMFFDGAPGIIGGNRTNIGGTWGVSARLNGLSFVENLTHDLSVTYISGTNDKANVGEGYGFGYEYLTSKDTALEFAAVNTFKMYKELSVFLEAAYIVEDYDTASRGRDFENDWRLSMTFMYTF